MSNPLLASLRRLESRHRAWRYRVRIDPAEIQWVRGLLRPGDVAVDAGAYKGGYTHWMRHEVGPSGRVIAFEPQPELAEFLRRVVGSFGWRNVEVIEAALSCEAGRLSLHVPGDGPSQRGSLVVARPGARAVAVQVDTLDRWLAAQADTSTPIRLIKCDVEGSELELFAGAEATLRTHRPHILFECEARFLRTCSMGDVFAFLADLGYRGRFFWRGALLDLDRFDRAVHQVEGTRPYANNFAFFPA